MKKKYIIISIVSVLVLAIGVSVSYFIAKISGEGSQISLKVGELSIIFTDNQEIDGNNIDLNWSDSKEFSVKNESKDIYYYNITIDNLYNDFVTNNLKYKINSSDGYDMEDYEAVPKGTDEESITLAEGIEIKDKETHTYTIEFKYFEDPVEDQSEDMEKHFSGKLNITKGEKTILVSNFSEKMKEQYPDTIDTKRDNFNTTIRTASAYYEDGDFIESEIEGATSLQNKVYYYSGAAEDNWVSFAGYYWRIIRTNEDGSLRLLYGGLESDKGNSTEQYISKSRAFNREYKDAMYAGIKYGTSGNLNNNRTNQTNNATILGEDNTDDEKTLNGWYKAKIDFSNDKENKYSDYLSKTAIYCNDRSVLNNSYSMGGDFYYGAALRLVWIAAAEAGVPTSDSIRPSFRCGVGYNGNYIESAQNQNDKFSGTNPLAKLTNPIGLMTADEIAYAGGLYNGRNDSAYYYLTADRDSATGDSIWWTMSPFEFSNQENVMIFIVGGKRESGRIAGTLGSSYAGDSTDIDYPAVRPVISLKSCLTLSDASGTADDPFVVQPISDECANSNN